MPAADLVLLCVEAGREMEEEENLIARERPVLVVRTKSDLTAHLGDGLPVSVVTGQGLDCLRRSVAERVFGDQLTLGDLEPALTRERHRTALARAQEALTAALPLLHRDGDIVLGAHQLREATAALDELIGVVDIEEVLDRIFGSFCVGK